MNDPDTIMHLDWDGPFRFAAVSQLVGPTDYGVYQIYGGQLGTSPRLASGGFWRPLVEPLQLNSELPRFQRSGGFRCSTNGLPRDCASVSYLASLARRR